MEVTTIQKQLKEVLNLIEEKKKVMLEKHIFNEKVVQAAFQLASLKPIGYDDLPMAFYQKFWFMLKLNVISMVRALFQPSFYLKVCFEWREKERGGKVVGKSLLLYPIYLHPNIT